MELKINIDLEAAIAKALSPEALQPILDKHITGAITNAIQSATSYGSEFTKVLTEQVKTGLPHGLGLDDLAKFQHVLNAAMNTAVQSCNEGSVRVALEKAVQDVMPDVPAVINLSDFMKEAREGFHKDENEAFYAYFEPSSYGDKDGGWLYLDGDEKPGDGLYSSSHKSRDARKYSAKHRLAINSTGDVYALKLDGKDVTPASRPDAITRFESLLMAMYVGRTKLEIDMDDDDVESASGAQYD